ncbi:GNAT family N-acetyltransferase [Duganella violaceipulchra]|uniref:GNAT family N-acetyltransferase n=1 Tax=Duganella violaceipulchra TaxID=2849652 RepID=A0AA41H9N4_9BURK|nr:GNAT family N-acetyltransferase [Duganella violaceicalia]MBV6323295.1 GNAT family N-acetyltransferase [Duganella violaceicalia]MCP2007755.1 ribosomal protein S18 acetylase RimI-like enzyme [Duganella violaceicalia]
MTYTFSPATPDATAFKALYDTTGWGPLDRRDEFYEATLRGSWASFAAYDADQLVGFARVISDGKLHAFITEMIVHPEYQRRGLGEELINTLVARCRAAGINDIQLFCAKGKADFYVHCGFAKRPDDAPGMQHRNDDLNGESK